MMDEILHVASAAVATAENQQYLFTEAQYLRETLTVAAWALGTLFTIVTCLVVWIYITRENQASEERRMLKRSQDSIKRALYDEGQTIRGLFHEQELRIQRLEDFTGLYHPSSRPQTGRRWSDRNSALQIGEYPALDETPPGNGNGDS